MTRAPRGLASRITALCLLVAVVTVVVSGVVADRLIASTADDLNREALTQQADGVAELVKPEDHDKPLLGIPRIVKVLRGQQVSIVVRYPDGHYGKSGDTAQTAARQAGLDKVEPGKAKSKLVTVDGRDLRVEARGLEPGLSFALVRPVKVSQDSGEQLLRNVLLALAIGLAVAVAAGLLLSAPLSRPLRDTAKVALAMRQGRRDLRAPVGGAAEVAEVARSVNELADALGHSESRQRDFLLSVSHELRTPLTSIKGFAESLADGVVDGDDTRRVGGTMLAEADRLERLVTDLLDLARIGADEFRLDLTDIDPLDIARSTAEAWRPRCADRDIDFRVEAPEATSPVLADPRRLRQVLDILMDNAVRLTPAAAPLVLAVTEMPAAVAIAVRDGGPGLSEDDYPVAFERGALHARYRGRRQGGSGVGLALAHRLTHRMGAELTVGAAPEGGAAFTVTFDQPTSLQDPNTTPTAREQPSRTVDSANP
ncbi:sensor histidine kinase [Stackebrandtia nassauensis]|uniref:histidine kinase n=1 Tax=Stackebrandtia nassauensis (strain DSM 44728 / CIP 108903 / NRRL B-16338 / NBRC 102104 / LLR-40K-21) TaxID=446470 RepID=D3PYX5_STANL|nr:HAMP domain-containing sensor histidine kinase [Stackebrandtia nassauensis]ADD43558.1 histidine kinase [Stackebrandtia nassauensis DSM 44728]